jgi:hypothetical protein
MKINSPVATLGAVAVLGATLWGVNSLPEPDRVVTGRAVAAAALPAPVQPAPPPVAQFPAKADYVGKVITTRGAPITVEITVAGERAVAYACDGAKVESWLSGTARNGTVALASKDKNSRLDGRLRADEVDGKLTIDTKTWDFAASEVQQPAGLYVSEDAGDRSSWIVDQSGVVTGVQRLADGTTSPALPLNSTAIRVDGDSDVR